MKLYPYPLNFGSELVFIPQIFPKFNQSSNIIPYKPSLVNYTACTGTIAGMVKIGIADFRLRDPAYWLPLSVGQVQAT